MRKLITLICLLLMAVVSRAQPNHVLNGSFEQYTQCPNAATQINRAVGWSTYTLATPDYMNACATGGMSVPNNGFGSQLAADGDAYAGVHMGVNLTSSTIGNWEFIKTAITPLQPGRLYEVSMSLSRGDNYSVATNDFGVHFYTSNMQSPTSAYIPVTPQVSYASYGIITDRIDWVRVTQNFVADSAYTNMVIGCFSPYNSMNFAPTTTSMSGLYYYIDSVVVKELAGIMIQPFGTVLCRGDVIHVPYILSNTMGTYNPGNVFTLQLSDANGSFATPVNIGSLASFTSGSISGTLPMSLTASNAYKVRIISSNIADTSYSVTLSIGNIVPDKPVAASNAPVCTGSGNLNLTATSATPSVTWQWTGPLLYASTQQNPTIASPTVAMSGDYIVEAAIYGCKSEKDTITVVINQAPATITAGNNSPICSGQTLNFTAGNTAVGTSYSWIGPGGFTSNVQNPTRANATTAMSGAYWVTATAVNGCSTSATTAVIVSPVPTVTATGNSGMCEGTALSLLATSSEPSASFSWIGPAFFTANTAAAGITNTMWYMSGNYVVTASLNGCSSQFTVPVTIKPMPAVFSASASTPVCGGQPINLVGNTSSAGVAFTWLGPSYSSSLQSPTIVNSTTAMSGDYELTANLNGCILKDTVTVEVKPTPTVTASSNFNICEGLPINMLAIYNPSSANVSWAGPGGYVASGSVAVRNNSTLAMSGNYIATASLNGCSAQFILPVVVNPTPIMPTASSNSIACDTLKFFASGSAGASYHWNGPGGYTSNQQNPYISPASPTNNGTYTVFSTLGSCVSPGVNIQASVHPRPYLGAYASPNDTVCDGTVVTFVTVPMNGIQNPQFQWFKNGVEVIGQTNLTYVGAYATGDKFYCRTYAQDLCNNNITLYSNEISMVVLPIVNNLSASISSTPAIPQPGQAINFKCDVVSGGYIPQFQWRKNGVDVNGAVSANWSANNLMPYDEITCHVTSSDPCAAPTQTLSNKVIINFPTTVNDVDADNCISIYPNPNSGNFTIESKIYRISAVEVLNGIGQKVYSLQADAATKLSISLPASLANGIYSLRLDTDAGIYQQRITLQR